MRTKEQMMDLILGIAKNDDRVRAVYMNGSRTNPNAPEDLFQDYDIVYVVEETASFIADRTWPERFGKTARFVAEKLGYKYNEQEEAGCLSYLQKVRNLPAENF